MAFSDPHQRFVYSPRRRHGNTANGSPAGKRKRPAEDEADLEDSQLSRNIPTTPRRRRQLSAFPSGTLQNGHPATPLAHDLGLTADGRRSRQTSANLMTPGRAGKTVPLHGGRAETDHVASMLAVWPEEGRSQSVMPVTLTPTGKVSSSSFADPSSITPRRAGGVTGVHSSSTEGPYGGSQQPNEGHSISPRHRGAVSAAVSEGDALAVKVLLGFSNSPTHRQSGQFTPLSLLAEASNGAGDLRERFARATCGTESSSGDIVDRPSNGSTRASQLPRTPSPTPSVTSAVPETPKTPNTSSAFAYSEYVNVSPSPQPRNRGPSGRCIKFPEGSGWDDVDQEDHATANYFMSPSMAASTRRSRRSSHAEQNLTPGPMLSRTPPRSHASQGFSTPRRERQTTAEGENWLHSYGGVYTPLRRHHASIALPLNAGFVSPVLKQTPAFTDVASALFMSHIGSRMISSSPNLRDHGRKRSNVTSDLSAHNAA